MAGTSLVGHMMGKKRPDLSTVYGKCSQRLALVISLVLASSIAIFREPLVRLFITSSEDANAPAVFAMACQVMLIVALFQPFQTSAVVFSGCLRGAGRQPLRRAGDDDLRGGHTAPVQLSGRVCVWLGADWRVAGVPDRS